MAADEQREILAFIADLIRATEAGEVQWEQAGPEAFHVATPGGIVRIESLSDQDHPFVVQIYDAEERLIYEMRTELAPFYNEPEMLTSTLFHAARGSLFDVGGTIQRIRHSLGM
jgi:hypothetical protein